MRKQLLVESIRIDGQTQSRVKISKETVVEYAEVMKADVGVPFPPLTVYFDGKEYWLADGFHRLLAAQRIGRKNIAAEVKQGSRKDAAWASCAANQLHGLRRTIPDKLKAAEIALKLHPEKSDRMLAEHCGVGHKFVCEVRGELVKVAGLPAPLSRVGKDGKNYPATRSKTEVSASEGHGGGSGATWPPPGPEERSKTEAKSTAPAQGPAPAARPPHSTGSAHSTSSGQASSPQASSRLRDEATAGTAGQACPVDGVGRLIPDHLLELWNRGSEVQDMLSAISMIRVALRKAQANRDPLFAEVPYSSTLIDLNRAYDNVQVTLPYAVCAHCQGHGCKACGQRGLIGKCRWNRVPAELKKEIERQVEKGATKDE